MLLKAEGITKRYGKTTVLDGVNLEIAAGQFIALLGHNGVGKSTLMKILMRREGATSGKASVLGYDFEARDVHLANREVAFVSEDLQFELDLPISDMGAFFGRFYPNWNRGTFDRLAGEFRLPRDGRPQGVSRGQKMQIAFAVAVAATPKLLFVDEITSVLDAGARLIALREMIAIRGRGGSVLAATNIVTDVQSFVDEVMILRDGKIVLQGNPRELIAKFEKLRIVAENLGTSAVPATARLVAVNSDHSYSYLVPRGHEPVRGTESDRRAISLEELFVYYTGVRE